ncbi:MAG TPA: beta-propeller fold lactonase family protein [Terracidiphilus sp.]|jgi:DNA-binding beta-propeller fold protein YncE
MKFSNLRQLLPVSVIGLGVAALLSGCQLVTIDYLYVATSASTLPGSKTGCPNGAIEIYAVDSQSGAIRNGATGACSGGTTPTALAMSPGYQNLYVANQVDMNIVHFAIANNGVLTKKESVTLTAPVTAMTVSPDGNTLYAVSGTTSATLSAFALSSGALASAPASEISLTIPGNAADHVVPTAIAILPSGNALFATAYDSSSYNPGGTTTSTANPGWLYGFAVGTGGALTPTPGSPYTAGVKPTGIATEPLNSYVYVTDFASNQLIGYGVYTQYALSFLLNGPYKTGGQPSAIAVDARGRFLYVSNSLDSSVNAYVIDIQTGTPSSAVNTTGSITNITDTQPVAIAVDPALARYVYTANFLGNSVSGFRLDPIAGTLKPTQATPYPVGIHPAAVALIPHGNHSQEVITP